MSFRNCTSVSPACPAIATTYGYYPSLGPNIALLTVFGIVVISQLGLVFIYRLWSYSFVIAAACLLEVVGYIGRLLMHANPWSETGFRTQIICLILGPSFLAAGIYLTLKHLVIYFGPEHSRLRPQLYTRIFIGCDVASILLQAAGGGVAASAGKTEKNTKLADAGNSIMMAGIAFQVATMVICGLLAADFGFSLWRSSRREQRNLGRVSPKAKAFFAAVALAYITILIRCIYR
jgi:hypothetical protein